MALSSRNFFLSKKELQLASNLTKNLIFFKKKLIKKKNIKNLLSDKKKSLNKFYNIKIEYLELRNKINLKKTSSLKNSKIFIAYFLNKIRLIDNF